MELGRAARQVHPAPSGDRRKTPRPSRAEWEGEGEDGAEWMSKRVRGGLVVKLFKDTLYLLC